MANPIHEKLDDLMECSICKDVYKEPRTLPCQHSFCLICCERFSHDKHPGDNVECPLCGEQFIIPPNGVRGLRKNFILEKLEQINQPCSVLQNDTDLTAIKTSVPSFCDKHCTKTLDWYCFGCKEAICANCLTGNHKSHNYRNLEEVFDELQVSLTKGAKDLQTAYDKYELSLNIIEIEEEEFMRHVQRIEAEIIKDSKRLQKMIEQSKSELLAEVSARKHERLQEVDNTKQEIRQQMAFISSLTNYTTELLKNGAAGDIAREANSLEKRTNKLLQSDEYKTPFNQLGTFSLAYTSRKTELTDLSNNLLGSVSPLKVTTTRSLAEDKAVEGVAVLNNHLYVSYVGDLDITVYDRDTYKISRRLKVPRLASVTDLTSCERHRCLYIADFKTKCVRKVTVSEMTRRVDACREWYVEDEPWGVSVNSENNVIVTCGSVSKVKVLTSEGLLLKVIILKEADAFSPYHTIQVKGDKYVVCHGGEVCDRLHRACIIDGSGKLEGWFGGSGGRGEEELSVPSHLGVFKGLVFVVDCGNGRVVMMNERLGYLLSVSKVSTGSGGVYLPVRMCVDEGRGLVYVGYGKAENDEWSVGGGLSVYSVFTEDVENQPNGDVGNKPGKGYFVVGSHSTKSEHRHRRKVK